MAMKFFENDGRLKENVQFPTTHEDRYLFACEELDLLLQEGKISNNEYYYECRNLQHEFYGDDYEN